MEKYEVVKTLIKGKQSIKKVETSKGVTEVPHKKPTGYVLKDLKSGELSAMTLEESVIEVLQHGATNVKVTATQKRSGEISPYIKANSGEVNLQDEHMVADPEEYIQQNPEVKVSKDLSDLLEKSRKRSSDGKSQRKNNPKYTKEELLASVKKLQEIKRNNDEVEEEDEEEVEIEDVNIEEVIEIEKHANKRKPKEK